jgi:metacaspase-1
VSKGVSLHIGLNGVDASKYNGWPGTLSGCINDANSMKAICSSRAFTNQLLINQEATSDAILTTIGQAAFGLEPGDTFVISYSGHGGQVPDTTNTSSNGLDDTWVAYDRMVLGHELYNLWSQFRPGVRIEVYSDSCHSGTVIRELITPAGSLNWPNAKSRKLLPFSNSIGPHNFVDVFGPAAKLGSGRSLTSPGTTRAIPPAIALDVFRRDQDMYEAAQWSRQRADIAASVILISACQDNQVAQDGQSNGLFTEKLLAVWDGGRFSGTLPQFHRAIVALMPASQTPNYFALGVEDAVFTNSVPLTIVSQDHATTPVASSSALLDAERATNTIALDGQIQSFLNYIEDHPAGRIIAAYVAARKLGIVLLLGSSQAFLEAVASLLRLAADLGEQLAAGTDLTIPNQAWDAIELVTVSLKTMKQDIS